MINRMICQTAPEERSETRICFAEGETPMRSRPLRSATHCFPFAVRYLRLTSTPVEPKLISRPTPMWVRSSFSTGLPSSPQAMVIVLSGFRPAGNILSILLILSKMNQCLVSMKLAATVYPHKTAKSPLYDSGTVADPPAVKSR